MFVFDAHLDLSLNAIEYNRDLRRSARDIRESEAGMTDLKGRGRGTVAFPDMREAGIGLCVATQLAGCMKPAGPVGSWNSPEQAHAMTQAQLAWYRAMEDVGELRQVRDWPEVEAHLQAWHADPDHAPIGYILSLEGADSLRTLADLERSHGSKVFGRWGPPTTAKVAMPLVTIKTVHSPSKVENSCGRWTGWVSFSTPPTSATKPFGKPLIFFKVPSGRATTIVGLLSMTRASSPTIK